MNIGKLAIGAIITFVIFFLTDLLWYGMLMKDSMTPMPGARAEPLMMYMIFGMLLYSIAFVYIYLQGVGKGSPAGEGARYGIWVTVLMWLPLAFIFYGLTDYAPLQEHLSEGVFRLVQAVVMGVVVAYATKTSSAQGKGAGGGDDD